MPSAAPTPDQLLRNTFLQRCGRVLVRAAAHTLMWTLFRRRHVNRPASFEGSVVLVANHGSFLDPLLVGAACPRTVSFLINSLSYRSPLMGWFYRLFKSIPVDPRGGNRDALRCARAMIEAGEVVGVFPEGGISRDGGLLLGNPGAVSLVLSKDVSVIPVGIRGADIAFPYGALLPRLKRIELHFGEPIPGSELMVGGSRREQLAQATERIMREIGRLAGKESREDELRRARAG